MKNFSPNMVILVIVLLLVSASAAIYFNRQNALITSFAPDPKVIAPEASRTATAAASPQDTVPETAKPEGTPIPSPTVSKTPALTPTLEDYIYPQSKLISQSPGKMELESSADAQAITSWYKDKIRKAGFNAKSFTQTNTNGVILNKLSGAKPGEKIEITIKKDQNASKVTITVDRS
ncbi:hypothetical protein HYW44_01760 [Candidatus Daviesbacteria bacterium]|nr:hypothetical protein [Candidatus Daviesbacteria bacterium]